MSKKVMIIGGSSGIGLGLAKHFLLKGYQVAATGRNLQHLYPLFDSYPGRLLTSSFDVNNENAIVEIDHLIQQLHGVDYFVYCAAIISRNEKPDWSSDQLIVTTNVAGFTKCIGHVFNKFLEAGTGHITIISSIASYRGGASSPVYNASKAYQSIYSQGLRLQAALSKANIKILDVKPGFVDTRMTEHSNKFWLVPLKKACKQIADNIESNKSSIVVSKRWYLIAAFMKYTPMSIYTFLTRTFYRKKINP